MIPFQSFRFLLSSSIFLLLFCAISKSTLAQEPTAFEKQLYELVMQYRKQQGLPRIPVSKKLTEVAQLHVKDLAAYFKETEECNMHSWSAHGKWQACCYKGDHSKPECMWNKPFEINQYPSRGYEIAYVCSDTATPAGALDGWKQSRGHKAVILNQGIWGSSQWKAIGIGMFQGYAVIWFGEVPDPPAP